MFRELAQHIEMITIVDTHEHLRGETQWIEEGPGDVLCDLFNNCNRSRSFRAKAALGRRSRGISTVR